VIISELRETCASCPSQWEGKLSDGRNVYIRYRWGGLTVTAYRNALDDQDAESLYAGTHGDMYDGTMDKSTLAIILARKGITIT
jgi:hypothetical protein